MRVKIEAILPVISAPISLRPGLKLRAGEDNIVIVDIDDDGVLLNNLRTNGYARATEEKLIRALQHGHVTCEGFSFRTLPFQITSTSAIQAEALGATPQSIRVWEAKIAWLKALRDKGIDRIVDEVWVRSAIEQLSRNELKGVAVFQPKTLYLADLEIRKAGGDLVAALPHYAARGGAGKSRLDPDVFNLLCACIQEAIDGEGAIIKSEIHQDIVDRVGDLNRSRPEEALKTPPGESTTAREIAKRIPAYIITERNKRTYLAKKNYRSNSESRDQAERPLEVVEYDDIDSGVFCVDERNGLPWGRPYITNGIDQCTKLPTGFDLSDRPRSFDSAIGAICHSMLPKEGLLPGEMGYGFAGINLMDNARYNDSKATLTQSAALNILLAPCRPRGPTEKNSNEHFNNIAKHDFCARQPGWVGEKGDREGTGEGMIAAACDINEFRRNYYHWLTKVYSRMIGDDGVSAKQRWNRFMRHGTPAVRYTPEQLALLRLRPLNLPLTFRASGGLLRLRLRYDCEDLDALRRRLGNDGKVQVFVDPQDMSYLVVVNPFTKQFLRVRSTEQADYITNLTEYQQKMILKICRQRGIKNPELKDLVQARNELAKLVAQASQSNKLRKRRWARQLRENESSVPKTDSQPNRDSAPKKVEHIMTELEYEMEELQSINLEEEEQW